MHVAGQPQTGRHVPVYKISGTWYDACMTTTRELLAQVPTSAYCLTNTATGKLHFFEVRTYKGHTYLRELFGAPGDFRRERVAQGLEAGVLRTIAVDVKGAAKSFAEHYSCCAVCKSPLTDETSRDRGVGPVCWGRFAA